MAASKKVQSQDENSENETGAAGDPNLVGYSPTAPIQDRRAGLMTSCQEYDQEEAFYSPRVRS